MTILKLFTRLEVIAFIVGMAILTFELTAARLVSPYIGNTIYTWTSIIGIILAALAFGYSVGGVWADTRKRYSDIVLLLLAAAVSIAVTAAMKEFVLSEIVSMPITLQFKGLVASLLLFALPTFIMGTIMPYLARLSISSVATSGRHLSKIDTASTIGSLVGTFLTGYVLFGYIGSHALLLFLGVILVATSLLVKDYSYRLWQIGALGLVLLVSLATPRLHLTGLIHERDTAYSHITIRDVTFGQSRVRVLESGGNAYQSGIFIDGTIGQPFAYVRALAYANELVDPAARRLVIGGGAFTLPEQLARTYPPGHVDVVEIDDQLPDIGRQYFHFQQPSNLTIIHDDGRSFLNQATQKYGVIMIDAFSDSIPPFQLMTRQAAEKAYAALEPNSVLLMNIISESTPGQPTIVQYIYNSYQAVFEDVRAYSLAAKPHDGKQNMLLVATKGSLTDSRRAEVTKTYPEFAAILQRPIELRRDNSHIMSDDFAPVERLAL